MVTRVATVAFEGIEARAVDVQVQVTPGGVAFILVGLPDKAVGESKERVRAALIASGLALPAKRITVNLAPADLPKEGSHYDLPIALGVMAAIGAIPPDALAGYTVLTLREPHGVTGHIVPWNYPMQIVGRSVDDSALTFLYFSPTGDSWATQNDRIVTCAVYDKSGNDVTNTLKAANR